MASFRCGCGKKIAARPEWAGRRVKCPKCGDSVVVPAADEEMDGSAKNDTFDPLLDAIAALDPTASRQVPTVNVQSLETNRPRGMPPAAVYGLIALAVVGIGVLLFVIMGIGGSKPPANTNPDLAANTTGNNPPATPTPGTQATTGTPQDATPTPPTVPSVPPHSIKPKSATPDSPLPDPTPGSLPAPQPDSPASPGSPGSPGSPDSPQPATGVNAWRVKTSPVPQFSPKEERLFKLTQNNAQALAICLDLAEPQ